MACLATAQASHYNTMCSLPFYLHITHLVKLKTNSAFLQPILFGEVIELFVPFMYSHPQRTDLLGQENK